MSDQTPPSSRTAPERVTHLVERKAMSYGIVGILVIILLVVLIIYFLRRA